MSAQIRLERNAYYDILEETQKGDLDVTAWLKWFLACLGRAIDGAESILTNVLRKARFWDAIKDQPLNERQRKVINLLLDKFDGKLTNAKWTKLTGTSSDTSLRDITDLVRLGVLVRDQGGGRSTSYSLADGGQGSDDA
jgi:Fic family protein